MTERTDEMGLRQHLKMSDGLSTTLLYSYKFMTARSTYQNRIPERHKVDIHKDNIGLF